jgi:hypothetical protein
VAWLTFSIALHFCIFSGSFAKADERSVWAPFPPKLEENVRWQTLPREYSDVFLDHEGRPWFFLEHGYRFTISKKEFSYSSNKRYTALISPEFPDEFIEIPYRNQLLGFDSKGRFWEVGKHAILATNPFKNEIMQQYPAKELDRSKYNPNFIPLSFFNFMFEHSSGRIYFMGFDGIYWLDESEEWLLHRFETPLDQWSDLGNMPRQVGAVEGPDGRFYVWSRRSGKLDALFVHEGEFNWKVILYQQEPKLKDLEDVIPLPDGTVEVTNRACRRIPIEALTKTPAKPLPKDAKATEYDPPWYFKNAALATDGPLSVYGVVRGTDPQGRIYVQTHGEPNAGGAWKLVKIFDPRVPETEPKLVVEPMPKEASYRRSTVIDTERHIWARLDPLKYPFLSRYENGAWTHFPVPAGVEVPPPDEKNPRELVVDPSYDWVMRPLDAARDWQPDRPRAEEGVPLLANINLLQPLDGGGLIAVERGKGRAFLYSHSAWQGYESKEQLIEKNYDLLKTALNNSVDTFDLGDYRIGRDATGRIWVHRFLKQAHGYNGEKWEEGVYKTFVFNHEGTRCCADKFLYDSSVYPPAVLSAFPLELNQIQEQFVHLDGHKTIWHVGTKLPGGAPLDPGFLRTFAAKRGPDIQDSAGRYWFCDSGKIYIVQPSGTITEFLYPHASLHHVVAEQSPEIFWTMATDALLRLRVTELDAGKLNVELLTRYSRITPQGQLEWMHIDAEGALWIACPRGETRLCRIQLPPVESKSAP